jgi:phosphoribosyl 1,2-cyclic phosphodiesterase
MRFASLGSGSAGNATLVQVASTTLLLDCGFGAKEISARLSRLDIIEPAITGILVTHEHDDHAKGAFKLAAKFGIPIWLTHGTYTMCRRYLPANAELDLRWIEDYQPFTVNDILVTPFPVPHDAREPSQFVFSDGQHKFGVLTDVGMSTPHIENMLSGCNGLMLECNHDLDMLHKGPYARSLKDRVSGNLGHLDNTSAATILSKLDNSSLKHIVAAHISAKNNTIDLAKGALSKVLNCADDWVTAADQELGLDWCCLKKDS